MDQTKLPNKVTPNDKARGRAREWASTGRHKRGAILYISQAGCSLGVRAGRNSASVLKRLTVDSLLVDSSLSPFHKNSFIIHPSLLKL